MSPVPASALNIVDDEITLAAELLELDGTVS